MKLMCLNVLIVIIVLILLANQSSSKQKTTDFYVYHDGSRDLNKLHILCLYKLGC